MPSGGILCSPDVVRREFLHQRRGDFAYSVTNQSLQSVTHTLTWPAVENLKLRPSCPGGRANYKTD